MQSLVQRLANQLRQLKAMALTIYIVARDPRLSMPVRLLALTIAAYAFSPIDFIPDFIPVLGLLDDVIVIPIGLALVIRLTPKLFVEEARDLAKGMSEKPVSHVAAAFVLALWALMVYIAWHWLV